MKLECSVVVSMGAHGSDTRCAAVVENMRRKRSQLARQEREAQSTDKCQIFISFTPVFTNPPVEDHWVVSSTYSLSFAYSKQARFKKFTGLAAVLEVP